jgi:hypothetical protein
LLPFFRKLAATETRNRGRDGLCRFSCDDETATITYRLLQGGRVDRGAGQGDAANL